MNRRIAERWAKALRSGRYEQGRHRLKSRDVDGVVQHCPLGVLCELAVRNGVIRTTESTETFGVGLSTKKEWFFEGCRCVLPMDVVKWADMKSQTGMVVHKGVFGRFSILEMNDERNASYEDLADHIEANWENL